MDDPELRARAAANAQLQITGAGLLFFGLMVVCLFGLVAWLILGLGVEETSGRGSLPFLIAVAVIAPVFGLLYYFLDKSGIKFTRKPPVEELKHYVRLRSEGKITALEFEKHKDRIMRG